MGECFNGDPAYVGPYQGPVSALFNYPMYYTIRDVYGSGKSAYGIRNRYTQEKSHFQDISVLGVFVDNHDNSRFLNSFGDHKKFENALVFSIFAEGIPFVYYGSEQGFAGGNDPYNRETLWGHYDTSSDLYKFIKAAVTARKTSQAYDHPHVERYVNDQFYAWSRGDALIATQAANVGNIKINVTFLPDSYK